MDLPAIRSRFKPEFDANPKLKNDLYALTHAEVGGQGPQAHQAFMETVFNRAAARNKSLQDMIWDRKYFPPITHQRMSAGVPQGMVGGYDKIYGDVFGGSNVSNFATGNASGTVGFNGGPQSFAVNGERFGVEGPDRKWAMGLGFNGAPSAAPVGAAPSGQPSMYGMINRPQPQQAQPQGVQVADVGGISPEHMDMLAKMGLLPQAGRTPQNFGEGLADIGNKINQSAWRGVALQGMRDQQAKDQAAWSQYATPGRGMIGQPSSAPAPTAAPQAPAVMEGRDMPPMTGAAPPSTPAAPGGMIKPSVPQAPAQPAADPRIGQITDEMERLKPLLANPSTRQFAMGRMGQLEQLQYQINDPMNAERLTGAQLDNRAKQKALDKPSLDTPEGRAAYAVQFGLTPDMPAYKSFVLTGKMPRQDQQDLTATDKKAILEADESVANNNATITALKQALQLSPKANSGPLASARATAGNFLPDALMPDWISSPESSRASSDYENLVLGQALNQLKATFGAAPTEGERKILIDLQASLGKPVAVREEILNRAIAAAEKRLGFAKTQSESLRGQDYFKKGFDPTQRAQQPQPPQASELVYNPETGKVEPKK